jgi:hypothetical protein
MSKSGNYQALNRLLTILYRSLPMYLTYASPWTHRGDEKAMDVLSHVVEDQRRLSTKIAHYIMERYGPIELGEYPADFPDTHDLAFDFLVGKLLACQKADVASIEEIVAVLKEDREAQTLAEESLGAARGHLETLEELAALAAKQGISWAKP